MNYQIMEIQRQVRYRHGTPRVTRELARHGMKQSMSRKGECWDNACAETFFKTLKTALIGQRIYRTREEAKAAIFEYIEVFYNRVRLHSYVGYTTSAEYEEGSPRRSAA